MDAKKKKRIVIWVSVAALLGVGGYFAYTKIIKPKLDERKAKKLAEEAAAVSSGATPTSSGSSAPNSPTQTISNPFPDKMSVQMFQNWMDKNHPKWVGATNAALNNGQNLNGKSGYGNFGKSTMAAWLKYKNEYQSLASNPNVGNVLSGWGYGGSNYPAGNKPNPLSPTFGNTFGGSKM